MKLWKISQYNNSGRYDVYDSAIVAAETKMKAKNIHPKGVAFIVASGDDEWGPVDQVKVEYLGVAKKGTKVGVICSSYNAG
jgi:hypothetical protein